MLALLVILIAFSCTPVFSDKLGISAMTLPWFVTLYCVGAALRIHPLYRRPVLWGILFVISIAALWLSRVVYFPGQEFATSYLLWKYNSVIVLCGAVAAFLLVLWHPVGTYPKWVFRLSSVTFGIYLIHDNVFFRDILWDKLVSALLPAQIALGDIWLLPVLVASIFLGCAFLEIGRKALFHALRIEALEAKMAKTVMMRQK